MAGHGGYRPGAGAPKGGVSETRRILVRGIRAGEVLAGRAYGLTGSDEDVAVKTVANIVADMIKSGNGADVLKLQAVVETRAVDDSASGGGSSLLGALGRMPAPGAVPAQSQQDIQQDVGLDYSDTYGAGATDAQSVALSKQPFFSPQKVLEFGGAGGQADGQADAREGGYPPPGTPPPAYRVDRKNFENFGNAAEADYSEVDE